MVETFELDGHRGGDVDYQQRRKMVSWQTLTTADVLWSKHCYNNPINAL